MKALILILTLGFFSGTFADASEIAQSATTIYTHLCGAPDSESIPGTTIIPGPMTMTITNQNISVGEPWNVKFTINQFKQIGDKLIYTVQDLKPEDATITIFHENNLVAVDLESADGQHKIPLRESYCLK